MTKTTREVLIEARKLIEKPDGWCRGTDAKDESGRCVRCDDPHARSFCAVGALARVSDKHEFESAYLALRRGLPTRGGVATFNDTHTHAEVIAAFDRAIEAAQEPTHVP